MLGKFSESNRIHGQTEMPPWIKVWSPYHGQARVMREPDDSEKRMEVMYSRIALPRRGEEQEEA